MVNGSTLTIVEIEVFVFGKMAFVLTCTNDVGTGGRDMCDELMTPGGTVEVWLAADGGKVDRDDGASGGTVKTEDGNATLYRACKHCNYQFRVIRKTSSRSAFSRSFVHFCIVNASSAFFPLIKSTRRFIASVVACSFRRNISLYLSS